MQPIEETTLLYEISEALNEHLDLKKSLYKVMDILSSNMDMVRGTITLLDPVRNEIRIEVAHGITRRAMQLVKYKLGEGITGRVIQTGKAVAIPKISQEPRFLNRTVSRRTQGELFESGDSNTTTAPALTMAFSISTSHMGVPGTNFSLSTHTLIPCSRKNSTTRCMTASSLRL